MNFTPRPESSESANYLRALRRCRPNGTVALQPGQTWVILVPYATRIDTRQACP
jgi:hypothetical protein